MKSIYIKELKQNLNNLTVIVAICIYLLLNGMFVFVFSDTNVLDYGFASLKFFFSTTPFVLIFLISAITMRAFADEFKSGTFEILATKPIKKSNIILGKLFASLTIVIFALLPTIFYSYTLSNLSVSGAGLDVGETLGAYLGLIFLSIIFIIIGIFCSSLTTNSIVSFLFSCFISYLIFDGFNKFSQLNIFKNSFIIETLGLDYHYKSISKGVINSNDLIYFISIFLIFMVYTFKIISKKTK